MNKKRGSRAVELHLRYEFHRRHNSGLKEVDMNHEGQETRREVVGKQAVVLPFVGARNLSGVRAATSQCKAKPVGVDAESRSGWKILRGRATSVLAFLFLLLAVAGVANAGNVQFEVSDPQITKNGKITITINGKDYPVSVTTDMKAADKANAIAATLGTNGPGGFTVQYTNGSTHVKLPKMPAANTVSLDMGDTGESKDTIQISGTVVADASIKFNNPNFSPRDFQGGYAVFTAGFTTDVGSLSYTFSSQFLSNTSGTTIASELFGLLQPSAGVYGVNLSLNGDTINATFDPADISNGAGVIFGTSSNSPSVIGEISGQAPEPSGLLLLGSGVLGLSGFLRKRRFS